MKKNILQKIKEEIAKFFSKTLESRMSKGKKEFFAYFVLQCFQNHFPLLKNDVPVQKMQMTYPLIHKRKFKPEL